MSQSRREFLKSVVGASSILSFAPVMPAFLQQTARAAEPSSNGDDRVLVVLQLSGGNDGLNTIVPYADDAYGRGRKTLRLKDRDVLKIDSYLGFHPQLTGFQKLLDDGHLSVLHGVGYPKNNRGHDEAMREWHTAQPGVTNCQTGWIGRAVDVQSGRGGVDVPAAFVGPIAQPFALRAEASIVPSVQRLDNLLLPADAKVAPPPIPAPSAEDNSLLDLVQRGSVEAQALGQRVEQVLANARAGADYPSFTLAGQLQTVSQLIQANVGVRIYFVELGGGGSAGSTITLTSAITMRLCCTRCRSPFPPSLPICNVRSG